MHLRAPLLLVCTFLCAPVVFAQPGTFLRAAEKAFLSCQGKIVASGASTASKAKALDCLRRVKGDRYYPMGPVMSGLYRQAAASSATSPDEALKLKTLENWLERHVYLSVSRPVPQFLRVNALPDYPALIAADARVILLGEDQHKMPRIQEEVYLLVQAYRKAHPDKNIYYAAEFADHSPRAPSFPAFLRTEADFRRTVRKNPGYIPSLLKMAESGVKVVGLEDPALTGAYLTESKTLPYDKCPTVQWASQPQGLLRRNTYWTNILEQIYASDPKAVVFLHAGMGHTDYNLPASLPQMLQKYKPYVVEFSLPGTRFLNSLLDQYAPVKEEWLRHLWNAQPGDPARFLRVIKDKRAARAAGCDLNILLPETF